MTWHFDYCPISNFVWCPYRPDTRLSPTSIVHCLALALHDHAQWLHDVMYIKNNVSYSHSGNKTSDKVPKLCLIRYSFLLSEDNWREKNKNMLYTWLEETKWSNCLYKEKSRPYDIMAQMQAVIYIWQCCIKFHGHSEHYRWSLLHDCDMPISISGDSMGVIWCDIEVFPYAINSCWSKQTAYQLERNELIQKAPFESINGYKSGNPMNSTKWNGSGCM